MNWANKSYLRMVLLTLGIFVSFLLVSNESNTSNAQNVKTMNLEAKLDKLVVKTGDTQRVDYRVVDDESNKPIPGVEIRSIVKYPGATVIKSINKFTDTDGEASIYVPINKNTPSDTASVEVFAFFPGYFDAYLTYSFGVSSFNIDRNDLYNQD